MIYIKNQLNLFYQNETYRLNSFAKLSKKVFQTAFSIRFLHTVNVFCNLLKIKEMNMNKWEIHLHIKRTHVTLTPEKTRFTVPAHGLRH